MTDSPKLPIRPGMGVMGLFRAIDYDSWYALGELVDNAVASYRQNRDQLESEDGYQFKVSVVVDHNTKSMKIRDNAGGIAKEDFARALIAGEPPGNTDDLSRFGMGMKSACCWWCDRWTLTTSALGEPVQRKVTFDIPRIVDEKIEELAIKETAVDPSLHFTEIHLESMTKSLWGKAMGKCRQHLADMYRRLLVPGDMVLELAGEELAYQPPEVLVSVEAGEVEGSPIEWARDFSFELDGKPVTGRALLRATGSVRTNGMSLFWRDRLIRGSADTPYRPADIYGGSNKYRSQRLSIEVDLNDFDVNNTKVNFIWPNGEEEFLLAVRKELERPPSFIRQAELYRAKQPSVTEGTDDVGKESLEKAADAIPKLSDSVEDAEKSLTAPSSTEDDGATDLDEGLAAFKEVREFQALGSLWRVSLELADSSTGNPGWLEVAADPIGPIRNLTIRVFRDSPFGLNFGTLSREQLEPQLRLAIGLGIAETICVDSGFDEAPHFIHVLNELLTKELARPVE